MTQAGEQPAKDSHRKSYCVYYTTSFCRLQVCEAFFYKVYILMPTGRLILRRLPTIKQKGSDSMNFKAIAKGVSAGVTVGAAVYGIYNSVGGKKRRMKSKVSKAMDSLGDMIDNISQMLS